MVVSLRPLVQVTAAPVVPGGRVADGVIGDGVPVIGCQQIPTAEDGVGHGTVPCPTKGTHTFEIPPPSSTASFESSHSVYVYPLIVIVNANSDGDSNFNECHLQRDVIDIHLIPLPFAEIGIAAGRAIQIIEYTAYFV